MGSPALLCWQYQQLAMADASELPQPHNLSVVPSTCFDEHPPVQLSAGAQTSQEACATQAEEFARDPKQQPTAQQPADYQTPTSAVVMERQASVTLVSTSASTASASESLADLAMPDMLHAEPKPSASMWASSAQQTVPLERQQLQQAGIQVALRVPTRVSSAVQTGGHAPPPGDAAHQQPGIGAHVIPAPTPSSADSQRAAAGATSPARHAGSRSQAIQAAEQVGITSGSEQQHYCL